MGQMAPARKDRKMSPNKLDEIARMSGLPEQAASEAAEAELDMARGGTEDLENDPFDFKSEENKAQRRDERKKDVIHTKIEDYDDQDEHRSEVEDEDEDDAEHTEDPIKLRRMLQGERRSKRRLVKKLSQLERGAALTMVESTGQVEKVPVEKVGSGDLLADLGIDDPEEPLSATQMVKLFGKLNEKQTRDMQAQNARTKSVDDFASRVTTGEKLMRQVVQDYDEVVTPNAGLLDPKSPDFDPGLLNFIRTRKNPAQVFYEMLTKRGG